MIDFDLRTSLQIVDDGAIATVIIQLGIHELSEQLVALDVGKVIGDLGEQLGAAEEASVGREAVEPQRCLLQARDGHGGPQGPLAGPVALQVVWQV